MFSHCSKRSPSQTVVTRWLCCIMPSVTSLEKPLGRHDSGEYKGEAP